MALFHLIYVSTSIEEIDTPRLDEIPPAGVRNNTPRNITGMLLYAGGTFMQVLEGEEGDVDEVFARIRRDPRHTDIFLLVREAIAERSFERWSMGFRRLGRVDAHDHPGYAPFFEAGFDAARVGARPGLAMEILRTFSQGLGNC